MIKEKKIFEKTINNNMLKLHFIFIGTEIYKNIDYNKLQRLIDNIFENEFIDDNLEKITSYIRTIFKDFEERSLQVDICTDRQNTSILFKNKILKRYRSKKIKNDGSYMMINYQKDKNPVIINLSDKNIIDKELKLINNLKKIEAKTFLTPEEKILCYCYHQFYNQYPDFSDKNTDKKIQIMMYLLNELSYCGFMKNYNLGYSFNKIPYEFYYKILIDQLAPLGEISHFEPIMLPHYMQKIIDIIKEEISIFLSDQQDKEKKLEQICSIDYINKFYFYNKANAKQIVKHKNISCKEEDITKVLKKVKEIRNRLYEE